MIKVNTDYKYKELCSLMGQSTKTGKSKQLQLKDWHRFFNWENPTKQIYRITEVYDVPKEKEDGRKNNGAKAKVQEEFDYLFNSFLSREYSRNSYNVKSQWGDIYFTNSEIDTYFGLRCGYYYDAKDDKSISGVVFQNVTKKIGEKRRSWIIDKIKKIDGIEYQDGIIAYKNNKTFDYRDDFLKDWNGYQAEYMKIMGFRSIADVIDKNNWLDMIEYISKHFEGYETVVKCHKVKVSVSMIKSFEFEEVEKQRKSFNQKLVKELNTFFSSKLEDASDYIHMINTYINLR